MTCDEPDLDRMRDGLMREVDRLARRRHVYTSASMLAGVVVVLAATTGAVRVVLASQQLRENAAYCYEKPSTSSRVQQVGDPSPGGVERAARAADLCASVWRAGFLGDDGSTRPPDDGRAHPVPELFVCENRDGTVAVFPHGPTSTVGCSDLGLAPAP